MIEMGVISIDRQHTIHAERDIVMANPSVRLSVCPSANQSNAGAVSKRTQISSHVNVNDLVGVSFWFLEPYSRYKILGEPLSRALNTRRLAVSFASLSTFRRTIQKVDFSQFMKCTLLFKFTFFITFTPFFFFKLIF